MLRALADAFVPGGAPGRPADHLAETIAALPHRADREELGRLFALFENRAVNALLAGTPRPFRDAGPAI